jgi:two-component system, OmpR family, response regulator
MSNTAEHLQKPRRSTTDQIAREFADQFTSCDLMARGNQMARILIVEDDESLLTVLIESLIDEHVVDTCIDGEQGFFMLANNGYDAAILDCNLPGLSGVDICKRYRAEGGITPIILLTANDSLKDRVSGLNSGADDYLTKPFQIMELNARIKAIFRRLERGSALDKLIVGSLCIEPTKFRVTLNDKEVRLNRKEFAILELLVRYSGTIFNADEIIGRAWKIDDTPSSAVVRSHIKSLRKKLGDKDIVQTVYGLGYRVGSQQSVDASTINASPQQSVDAPTINAHPEQSGDASTINASPEKSGDASTINASPEQSGDASTINARPQQSVDTSVISARPQQSVDTSVISARPQQSVDASTISARPQQSVDASTISARLPHN